MNKTKTMVFRRNARCRKTDVKIMYGVNEVKQVDSYKYLGVVVDETLSFKQHVEEIAVSGSRALGAVLGKSRELGDLGYASYDRLINSCVFSVLDYGAEITGAVASKVIEDVQNRATRFFMGVNRFCPLAVLNVEMGWMPSSYRRKLAMIRYYERLLKMDNNRIPKRIFLNSRNSTNGWSAKMRSIMEDFNLLQYWDIMSGVPHELLSFHVREKLKVETRAEIAQKPNCKHTKL